MRLHHVTITPRSVTIDGIQLTVHEAGPRVEQIGPDHPLSIVHIPVLAEHVTLSGDTHHPDESTPIYDQTLKFAINANIHTRCGREKHPADWRNWSTK